MRLHPFFAGTSWVFSFSLGCSSAPNPPHDREASANECTEVASGATPTKLAEASEAFNMGDLSVRAGYLYWRTNGHAGWSGGLWSMPAGGGTASSMVDGDLTHLVVNERGLYWFDFADDALHFFGDVYGAWKIEHPNVDDLAAEPNGTGVWYTFQGTLHRFDRGTDTRWYGDWDKVAVAHMGVYSLTTKGERGHESGELVMFRPGPETVQTFASYADQHPVALRADDLGVVWLFSDELGTVAPDGAPGSFRILRSEKGRSFDDLAVDARYAYWTEVTDFGVAIRRAARDGSHAPETLLETRCKPTSLASDGATVYWTTTKAFGRTGYDDMIPGAVWSAPAN